LIFNKIENPSKKDLLSPKQNRYTFTNTEENKGADHEFTLVRIKHCIKTIMRSINILSSTVYTHLEQSFSTENLFFALNKIIQLEDYSDCFTNDKIPLSWYSLYLNSNLMFLNEEYKKENYKLLYEDLMQEAKKESEMLNYKSNLIITKLGVNLRFSEKNSDGPKRDVYKVKWVEKFIRVEKFIESARIHVCVRNKSPKESEDQCCVIISKPDQCIHRFTHLDRAVDGKAEKKNIISNSAGKSEIKHEGHCENIGEFIQVFQNLKEIKEDIFFGDQRNKTYEALDNYLALVKEAMNNHPLFIENVNEENISSALDDIENYILLKMYKKVFPEIELEKDKLFHDRCCKLDWITPTHLEINKKYINENLWLSAINHLNKLEFERSPVNKLKCVQAAYKILNNCINFCSGKDEGAGVDDIIPILIFIIIKSRLKRIFSNVNYIKTFMNPSKLLATYGFLLTQIEMAIEFIFGLDHKILKMSEEEFNSLMK